MKKLTTEYIAGVLDFFGCWKHMKRYKYQGYEFDKKYLVFTSNLKRKERHNMLKRIFDQLDIEYKIYLDKSYYCLHISKKEPVTKLKNFVNKHCLIKKVKIKEEVDIK